MNNLLSPSIITQFLSPVQKSALQCIEVFPVIDSTNTYLLNNAHDLSKIPRVCIAETQTAGRGRLSRPWHSPAAHNIYLSLLWQFKTATLPYENLAWVVAMSVTTALNNFPLNFPVTIKKPNDLFVNGKKLGGVLIETSSRLSDNKLVVIGIGLNVGMTSVTTAQIDQPWISLHQVLNTPVDRNQLIGNIVNQLFIDLARFDQ